MQRFGLCLMWLFLVLGRNHRALAEQDLPTPMAQTLVDAVIGPAALTHICVEVRMQVWMRRRRLDLLSLVDLFMVRMVTHIPQRPPLLPSRPGPKVRTRNRTTDGRLQLRPSE